MDNLLQIDAQAILDCLGEGVYVTDAERRILYWNQAAERITGWPAEDIVGHACFDNILSHVDKDGHRLCGKEFCPLLRSIVTGASGECPLMFAKTKDGRRIPLQATVAPLRNGDGEIIGGVEAFRDLSQTFRDIQRARAIQSISLQRHLPKDDRVQFATLYAPHDIVGGDFYGIEQLDADRYVFFLADVMGHGIAAALYTMHLSALWNQYHPLLKTPSAFAVTLSNELNRIVLGGEAFAAGICGLVDLGRREIVFTGAGNPPAVRVHPNGRVETVNCSGLPFGVMKNAPYDETHVEVGLGDCFLFFTDGAVEVYNADDTLLGVDGLIAMLKTLGYPGVDLQSAPIERTLLEYSNALRLEDDLTFLEIQFPESA